MARKSFPKSPSCPVLGSMEAQFWRPWARRGPVLRGSRTRWRDVEHVEGSGGLPQLRGALPRRGGGSRGSRGSCRLPSGRNRSLGRAERAVSRPLGDLPTACCARSAGTCGTGGAVRRRPAPPVRWHARSPASGHDPPRADRRAGAIGRRAASSGTHFARSPSGHDPPRADHRAGTIGRRAASSGTCFARSPSGHDRPPRGLERDVFRPVAERSRPAARRPSSGHDRPPRGLERDRFRPVAERVAACSAQSARRPLTPTHPGRPRTHETGPAPKDRPRGGVWRAASPGCRSACPSGRSSGP